MTREHANFHEPLAVGAAVRHEVTGEPAARDAARNLLSMLRRTRSYATGGTCDGERWQASGRLASAATSTETQETCTQVNLERLAQRALGWSNAKESADWWERCKLNSSVRLTTTRELLLKKASPGLNSLKGGCI